MTGKSIAPIRAGSAGVITTQLDELPTSGNKVIGVDESGQLLLIDTEDLPQGEPGPPGDDGANGRGIASIVRTSGTGAAGTTDTYTITFTDSTTTTFAVVNGANGANGSPGAAGPNEVSIATSTLFNGILGGNGSKVYVISVGSGIELAGNALSVSKTSIGLGSVDNVSAAALRDRSTHTGNLNVDKSRVSATNFESFVVDATTNATTFRIGTQVGSAGGSQRAVQFGAYNSAGVWFTGMQIEPTGTIGDVNYAGGSQLSFSGNGVIRWIASAVLRLTNAAINAGVCLSLATDGLLVIRNRANSSDAALQCSGLRITSLPTSNPAIAGQLWNDGGTVRVSAG